MAVIFRHLALLVTAAAAPPSQHVELLPCLQAAATVEETAAAAVVLEALHLNTDRVSTDTKKLSVDRPIYLISYIYVKM